jgi:hypothetical protein
MELNTTREATGCATPPEMRRILWNPNVHYRVRKSSALITIVSETIPVSSRSFLMLLTHFRLGLPSGPFPSVISNE